MTSDRQKIDISALTIIKIVAVLASLYILYLIRDTLLLLFVVFLLVAALQPVVNKWSKKIGRRLSVFALLLILIGGIVGFIYLVVPPFVNETIALVQTLPDYAGQLEFVRENLPTIERALSGLVQGLGDITARVLSLTAGVIGGVVAFLTVIVLTVYLLLDQKFFRNMFSVVIPPDKRDEITDITEKVATKVGSWLKGQLFLGLIIGALSFIGLSIIGVPYAITLAVVAGLLEIIPVLGPIIAGILAALIALTVSPLTAVFVVAFYIIIQQVENNLLVPKIMQKAIGLPPAIIIVAILLGGSLLGILGALLAVPVSGIIYVLFQEREKVSQILRN